MMAGSLSQEDPGSILSSNGSRCVVVDTLKDKMTGSSLQEGPGSILSSEDNGSDEEIVELLPTLSSPEDRLAGS